MKCISNHLSRMAVTVLALAIVAIGAFPTRLSAQGAGYTVTLLPANPTTLEPVIVQFLSSISCVFDPKKLRIQQNEAVIRVDVGPKNDGSCVVTGSNQIYDVLVGRFPPGAFRVDVFDDGGKLQVASIPFTVTDSYPTKSGPFPIDDYTDHWWDPQELGWGISIMQHTSDQIVATWFAYDQAGHPVWYSLQPGAWTFNYPVAVYTGPVFKTTGPYFGAPFDFSKLSITQVGTGTLTFTDHNNGTFAYTVEGHSAEKAITRLSF